jgi:hypothetical protein
MLCADLRAGAGREASGPVRNEQAFLESRATVNVTLVMPPKDDVGPEGKTWRNAAMRVRCGVIAEPLGRMGARVKMVYSQRIDRRRADGSWYDADVYVFYQTLEDYGAVVDELLGLGKMVVVDLCDDVFGMEGRVTFAGEIARRATAVTVPTHDLARRLADRVDTPIRVVPDAVEWAREAPRAPGGDGALRVLWYGWQHKCGALTDRIPDLTRFASERRPVLLSCVTDLDPIQPDLARIMRSGTEDLSIRVFAWTLEVFAELLTETDVVVMPDGEALAQSGRSPIRMVQAFQAGRWPIVEIVDSFEEFAPFECLCETLSDGLERMERERDLIVDRITRAQDHIHRTRGAEVVARRWYEVLSSIVTDGAVDAAPALSGASAR